MRKYFQKQKTTALHKAVINADIGLTRVQLQENHDGEEGGRISQYLYEKERQWRSKAMHERNHSELNKDEIDKEASLKWLRKGYSYPVTGRGGSLWLFKMKS